MPVPYALIILFIIGLVLTFGFYIWDVVKSVYTDIKESETRTNDSYAMNRI